LKQLAILPEFKNTKELHLAPSVYAYNGQEGSVGERRPSDFEYRMMISDIPSCTPWTLTNRADMTMNAKIASG
jgi:hypothetical protein